MHLPLRRPLELKPVHQEVITEDGQRISVDVNLRLISPTAQGEREQLGHENVASSRHSGPTGEPRQRWPGQPYPADNALSTGQVLSISVFILCIGSVWKVTKGKGMSGNSPATL